MKKKFNFVLYFIICILVYTLSVLLIGDMATWLVEQDMTYPTKFTISIMYSYLLLFKGTYPILDWIFEYFFD